MIGVESHTFAKLPTNFRNGLLQPTYEKNFIPLRFRLIPGLLARHEVFSGISHLLDSTSPRDMQASWAGTRLSSWPLGAFAGHRLRLRLVWGIEAATQDQESRLAR